MHLFIQCRGQALYVQNKTATHKKITDCSVDRARCLYVPYLALDLHLRTSCYVLPVRLRRQILYPVLMFVMVCRTIIVRVLPDALIVFETTTDSIDPEDGHGDDDPDQQPSLYSRVKNGLIEDGSFFSWADTGQWVTAERGNQEAKREGDSFRIGFEPIFVDFTKTGSWFMAFSLLQVRTFNRTTHLVTSFECTSLIWSYG